MIHYHVGGPGVMIGDQLWQLYTKELNDMNNKEEIFYETKQGYLPRAIFADLDNRMINSLQVQNQYKKSIKKFVGTIDSASTFSCGHYTYGKEICQDVLNSANKLAEQCDLLKELIFTCGIAGGSGSGFTSLLSYRENINFPKIKKSIFYIFPSPQMNNSIIYPYNTLLAFHEFLDQFQTQVLFDNQGIYKMLDANIELDTMDYKIINNVVSQTISSYTSLPRFNKKSNTEIFNSLIPHPRLQLITPSYGPLISINDYHRNHKTFTQLQQYIFSEDAQLFYKKQQPFFLSTSLISRGLNQDIFLKQNNKLLNKIHAYGQDSNIFISDSKNYQTLDELASLPLTQTLFANDGNITIRLNQICEQFDKLYAKRAFCHYFTNDGLEFSEFRHAREDLQQLIEEYEEISNQNQNAVGEDEQHPESEIDDF